MTKIRPYEDNPRTISGKRDAELADSLARLGDISIIVHDWGTGEIIGGNQRGRHFGIFGVSVDELIASGRLHLLHRNDKPDAQGTLAIGYLKHGDGWYAYRGVRWSKRERQEANIRANTSAGSWDWDGLANSFDAGDLAKWGFDDEFLDAVRADVSGTRALSASLSVEPEDAEPQISRADELLEKWRVKAGDMWRIGNHRLLCGDSTIAADVARLMGDEKANFCITSSPYYNMRDYSFFETYEDYLGFVEKTLTNIKIVAEPKSFALMWNVAADVGNAKDIPADASIMARELGFRFCGNIVWVKAGTPANAGKRSNHIITTHHYYPLLKHEMIIILVLGNYPAFDKSDTAYVNGIIGDVWEINQGFSAQQRTTGHSAPFPLELAHRAILSMSQRGAIVYEPFGGSGTTMLACEVTGRINRSMELSPAYCAVMLERMRAAYPDIIIERDDGAPD